MFRSHRNYQMGALWFTHPKVYLIFISGFPKDISNLKFPKYNSGFFLLSGGRPTCPVSQAKTPGNGPGLQPSFSISPETIH